MSTSLFNRLYSDRQREGKNNRENFLIELLGYALERHEVFRLGFLELMGLSEHYEAEFFLVNTPPHPSLTTAETRMSKINKQELSISNLLH